MKKYLFILFVVLFEKAVSQIGINFSTTLVSDDNVFKNPIMNYSNISSTNASIFYNHFTESSQFKLSYGLNLNSYNNYSTANNNTNAIELDYALSSEDEANILTLSLSYSDKAVKDEYELYKEQNLNFFSNYAFPYNEIHSGEGHYSFNKITYNNFSDFSYAENILGYTSIFTWQTKTSLFLDANLGYKIYSSQIYTSSYDSILSGNGTTKGKGKMKKIIGILSNTQEQDKDNLQILLTGRIAQALHENLGTFFSYSYRYNIINNSRSIMISDYYFSDDNLFDDTYGYGGHELEMGLTYKTPLSILMKSTVEYSYKNYANEYPDATNALTNRSDNKLLFNLRLSRAFDLFESYINNLNLYLSYTYLRNKSNINPFNYTNNIYAIGINTTINF